MKIDKNWFENDELEILKEKLVEFWLFCLNNGYEVSGMKNVALGKEMVVCPISLQNN